MQLAHDTISRGVYASVRGASTLAGHAADRALSRRESGRAISATPRGAVALAVLNGLIGDALEQAGSDLQEPMAVRLRGRIVEPAELADAFPGARPRLVVFLHGLMETEHAWRLGGGPAYGARLERELGCSALDVRYNTGRHISSNGRSLAELLERIVAEWPVEVEQIALVGHSMGGLVARSACFQAADLGHDWVGRVRHVVSLGSPHMGAPLAQGVHYAAHALHAVPETRPFARFLRRRSAGIRDLRQGSLVDRDWERLRPRRAARRRLRRGAAARGRGALLRDGDDHAPRGPPARARCSATRSCSSRARQAAAARAGSRSASRTGCTSAARTT